MINNVVLVGRLTKDVELKMTQNGKKYCRFCVAINRPGKDKGTDFVNCVAWNQTAEFVSKYFFKGGLIGVEGLIQTGSYDGKDGKVYTTDVLVKNISFVSSKSENTKKEEDKVIEQMENKEKSKEYSVEDVFGTPLEENTNQVDENDLPF